MGKWKKSIRFNCCEPIQPRKIFDEESLQELADSIKEHGILQPIAVRKKHASLKLLLENVVTERAY